MKNEKSWFSELIKEFIIDVIWAVPVLIVAFIATGNILFPSLALNVSFAVLATVLLRIFLKLYVRIVLQKLPKSKFYRLPQVAYQGKITEMRIHRYPINHFLRGWIADCFFCEWIKFISVDGRHVKVYISAAGLNIDKNPHFQPFNAGAAGTLHYRKGKKRNYFEEFVLAFED